MQQFLRLLPAKVRKVTALAGYASEGIPATTFSEYEGLLAHAIGFLDKFARDDLRLRCEDAYRFVRSDNDRAVLATMLADVTNFLTPLLRRLDRMSMAASVECRTPFLDHQLVKTILNLPLSYRLRGRTDKWMLKEIAARHVPRSVVYRRKVGFPLPVKDYLAPLARTGASASTISRCPSADFSRWCPTGSRTCTASSTCWRSRSGAVCSSWVNGWRT
jgi:hypothetical protein